MCHAGRTSTLHCYNKGSENMTIARLTRPLVTAGAVAVLTLAVAGCGEKIKVTGGGTIPSANENAFTKANFGFNGDSCDGDVIPALGSLDRWSASALAASGGFEQ